MKNQTQFAQQKGKKENQLVFLEYEKPTKNGHFMTIMDSYRNIIGRVYKSFDEDLKHYQYTAFNHEGNPFSSGINLGFIKNEFIHNREDLLEQAHQRRIASKEKSKQVSDEKSKSMHQPDITNKRKDQMEKLRQDRTGKEKLNEKPISDIPLNSDEMLTDERNNENNSYNFNDEENDRSEREQELNDLRSERDEGRGDYELDR
jgi:hypothetical protein